MATILIVDKHDPKREYLSTLLTHSGHRVIQAVDGPDALSLIRESPCDLIISDILMPTMDGLEFVTLLRGNAATALIPVVFCTAAYHAREAKQLAKTCRVREVLSLPAESDVVIAAVTSALAGAGRTRVLSARTDLDALRIRNRTLIDKARDLGASNLRLKAVLALGEKLGRERDLRALMDASCNAVRELVGSKYAGAASFNPDGKGLSCCVATGMDASHAAQFSATAPLLAQLRGRMEKTRATRLKTSNPDLTPSNGAAETLNIGSALCVRIETPARRHGFLYCLNKVGASEFSTEDQQLAVALSAQVATCCESVCRLSEFEANLQALKQEVLERERSEKLLRENEERFRLLSNRLLQLQDEERRRIARELHDTTSQGLALVAMNLDLLSQKMPQPHAEVERILSDSRALIEQCTREIRTTSYLLHPPLLEEAGLAGALGEFAEGFSRRSGIAVTVKASPDFGRLPRELEIALCRVAQESLANIHKHSGSSTAAVRLARTAQQAALEIEDHGRGLPLGLLQNDGTARLGVGILGMRERLKQLGGQLEIASSTAGVRVRAVVPLG